MSQFDFATIDPNAKSGTQLAVDLNNWRDALHSGHRGASRPAYAQGGMLWVRETSAEQWDLMFYDGDTDFVLRSVNPTTNQLIGVPQASIAGLPEALQALTDTKQPLDPVLTALADQAVLSSADAAAARATIAAMADEDASFTIIYPNGGSAASPANIALNSRYVISSPFPGSNLLLVVELLVDAQWRAPGGWLNNFGGTSHGTMATQLGDTVVVRTGTGLLMNNGIQAGTSYEGDIAPGPLPCRVKVWKVKGAVA